MRNLVLGFSFSLLCAALTGCGDGTLEVKTKSAGNNGGTVIIKEDPVIIKEKVIVKEPVVIERPAPTRETTRTETTTPRGNTTTTIETKTTR